MMMRETYRPRTAMLTSALVALALGIVPLPEVLDVLRPDFLVLVVLYWSIAVPQAGGLTLAFIAGLLLDIKGVVLGQNALALTLAAAWATYIRLRIRAFPLGHQTLTIFALLTFYQFVLFWIDGATGNAVTSWGRWLAPITGALAWPFIAAFLSRFHER
jgi:rod shape-determining protein MreD